MTWTDERVEQLKKLWMISPELSARDIARRLGGVTRNAVIGKVHRLGLAARKEGKRRGPRAWRA
jgi:GcrA cell cycle regulator